MLLSAAPAPAATAYVPLVLRSAPPFRAPEQGSAFIPAGTYRLDRAHSRLTARMARADGTLVLLRFDRFDARFAYDPARPAATRAEVMLDPVSYRSESTARAEPADLGAVAQWRSVSFLSTAFTRTGPVNGTLSGTVRFFGFERPLGITLRLTGITPGRATVVRLHGLSAFTMPSFPGLQWGGAMQFDIDAQFIRS